MIFKDLKENDLVYAYYQGEHYKTFKFIDWKDDKNILLFDLVYNENVVLTINNRNQSQISIQTSRGIVKLSTREWK